MHDMQAFRRASFGHPAHAVTRLGFGAMGLGGHFGVQDPGYMEDVVLEALALGVNFIDTARAYGPSEKIVGRALRRWNGPRPLLATKALPGIPPAGASPGAGWQYPVPVDVAYPVGSIRNSLRRSLDELGTGSVDLLQLHQYWAHWDNSAWLDDLAALRAEGLVGAIGVSVPDHRPEMACTLVREGMVDSVQVIINIFDPLALDCLAPMAEARGIAIIARCILDEGGLTGFLRPDTHFAPDQWIHGYFDCVPRETYLRRVEALREFVPGYASSLAELAIRYVLSFPAVTVALSSMHLREHLHANLRALDAGPLPAPVLDKLRHHHRWIRNFYHARRHLDVG